MVVSRRNPMVFILPPMAPPVRRYKKIVVEIIPLSMSLNIGLYLSICEATRSLHLFFLSLCKHFHSQKKVRTSRGTVMLTLSLRVHLQGACSPSESLGWCAFPSSLIRELPVSSVP